MKPKTILIFILSLIVFTLWLFFLAPGEKKEQPEHTLETERQLLRLADQPEKYRGYLVKVKGIIANQPEFDSEGYHFQLYLPIQGKELNFIVDFNGSTTAVIPQATVLVSGKVKGDFLAETFDNKFLRLTRIAATQIKPVSKIEFFSPTIKRLKLNLAKTDSLFSISLKKVEFAKEETRFYLTARNKGDSPIIFKLFDAIVIAGKKVLPAKSELPEGYPQLPDELQPHSTAAGVLLFPPLPLDKNVSLLFRYVQNETDRKIIFALPSD